MENEEYPTGHELSDRGVVIAVCNLLTELRQRMSKGVSVIRCVEWAEQAGFPVEPLQLHRIFQITKDHFK